MRVRAGIGLALPATACSSSPAARASTHPEASDPHNPDLNKVLGALELRPVFLKTIPAETGRNASTEVYST